MLELGYIFETFRKLDNAIDKAEFIRDLQKLDLPYDLNYENLILAWERMAEVESPTA